MLFELMDFIGHSDESLAYCKLLPEEVIFLPIVWVTSRLLLLNLSMISSEIARIFLFLLLICAFSSSAFCSNS